jgi:hypothetical protein
MFCAHHAMQAGMMSGTDHFASTETWGINDQIGTLFSPTDTAARRVRPCAEPGETTQHSMETDWKTTDAATRKTERVVAHLERESAKRERHEILPSSSQATPLCVDSAAIISQAPPPPPNRPASGVVRAPLLARATPRTFCRASTPITTIALDTHVAPIFFEPIPTLFHASQTNY